MTEPVTQEQLLQDPHPIYARLRSTAPVSRLQLMMTDTTAWLVTSYAEAREAFTHSDLSRDQMRHNQDTWLEERVRTAMNSHMLNADPPDHTRLRRLVTKVFTMRRINSLEPRITEIADGLLDRVATGEPVDLIDAYAFPLPMQVICELLGVPGDDRDDFRAWSNIVLAGAFAGPEKMQEAARAMIAYIRRLLAAKRESPADDLLSDLVQVRDEDDTLSEDELIAMVFLLLVAGHETTVNLIGNGLYQLLLHPDQLARLRADRSLVPSAVEEILRYEGPLRMALPRFAVDDFELGGQQIHMGDMVFISTLAANRDSEQFEDAETFDVGRERGPHVAFGHGLHFCLGAPLARLEGRIAFDRLLDHFGDIAFAADPDTLTWRPSGLLRGLQKLPVMVTPAATG
ncbi:cytochrome P450 family protein [Fodinicola acaciae]|uniref:cytochrome P450 family protein n=1 Tax=Fodinicola acaciae TaxID=2681555 RepID=UPI0013D10AC7|nr:cytochrome P450 [Fodinicola acaciae]